MRIAVASLLLAVAQACAAFTAASASPSSAPDVQEINKAVARRVFDEIFNQGKFEVANEIYAPDFVNHGLHRDASLQEDQAAARWEKEIAPDLHMDVVQMVAERDLVSVVWIAHGTNTHALGWLPATGAKFELRGITVWRIVNGRLREEWTAFDLLSVARQVVSQLIWQIILILCIAGVLLWAIIFGLRRLFRRTPPLPA